MIRRRVFGSKFYFRFILIFVLLMASPGICQKVSAEEASADRIALETAVMCEAVKDLQPINQAIAFSITIGKVICYTEFSGIPRETVVLHRWYRRDVLVTEKKLALKPPRWSTFSSIQLRESDKGPWRVNIVNSDEQTLKILRFSVTE